MTTWRYVAARERIAEEDVWTIRELYDDDGKLSWSAEGIRPQGGSWMELMDDLSRMGTGVAAAQYLDLTIEPPALTTRRLKRARLVPPDAHDFEPLGSDPSRCAHSAGRPPQFCLRPRQDHQ